MYNVHGMGLNDDNGEQTGSEQTRCKVVCSGFYFYMLF